MPSASDIPLHTQTLGHGPERVVFLHGFLGQGKNLTTLARRLCERHPGWSAVLVDLLGHGLSPALPAGADLDTLADGVVPLAGRIIIGHSLGGRVALKVAERVPLEQVVLLDIAPGPVSLEDSDTARLLQAMVDVPRQAPGRDAFRQALLDRGVARHLADWQMLNVEQDERGAHWRGAFDPLAMADMLPRNNAADLWSVVEGGQVKVHEIRGDRSPYVTDRDVERLRAAGARVDTLSGVGHFVHTEGLERLLPLLD